MTIPMTAKDVRESIALRWPASENLLIQEASLDSARQGRKIDVLVWSMWASRGYERHAIEVKVSASDWKRELDNAKKSDGWWAHTHRFWVAVPTKLVAKVKAELPDTWGLLGCDPEVPAKTIVQAPKHEAQPFTEAQYVGLMRASADAGLNALQRERDIGRREGEKSAKVAFELRNPEDIVRKELETLREQVKAFNDATGLTIGERYGTMGDAARLGRFMALLTSYMHDPQNMAGNMAQTAGQLRKQAALVDDIAKALVTAVDNALPFEASA